MNKTAEFNALIRKLELELPRGGNDLVESKSPKLRRRTSSTLREGGNDHKSNQPPRKRLISLQLKRDCKSLFESLEEFRVLLRESRIAMFSHSSSSSSSQDYQFKQSFDNAQMSDELSKFVSGCVKGISVLQQQLDLLTHRHSQRSTVDDQEADDDDYIKSQQHSMHWQAILDLLRLRLSILSREHKQLQEDRLQQLIERRLVSSTTNNNNSPSTTTTTTNNNRWQKLARKQRRHQTEQEIKLKQIDTYTTTSNETDETELLDQLDQRQLHQLEQENKQLASDLQGLEAEIDRMEHSLLEIGELQSQLETHLSLQSHDISRLFDEAESTTASVLRGNAILHRISGGGVAYRNFMLLFFWTLSAVLLFLHWYE